jgi:hypothetical protein
MRIVVMLFATALLGCQPDVVKWEESREIATSLHRHARLAINGDRASFELEPLTTTPFTQPNLCPRSLRVAGHAGKPMHAVWWSLRADSTAALLASRSDDRGITWNAVVPVDTTDVSRKGCERLPPSIAVDAFSGYIHVVYSLENATGTGVFFSHSMEGGQLYHAPVPIVFGTQESAADVAAERGRVVVAYEDPNMREESAGRIALAISQTDGHIFEHRVSVTRGGVAVSEPAVAIAGEKIAVAWRENPAKVMARIGRLAGHTGAVPAKP